MADVEQKDRSSESQKASCEILRLIQRPGVGQALPMILQVHAYIDDRVLKANAKTAKDAFAKAIEWHVVRRLTDISISDGTRSYSIAEFASVIALAEIAEYQSFSRTQRGKSEQ